MRTAASAAEAAPSLCESPHLAAPDDATTAPTVEVRGYTIDAHIDPRVVNGTLKVCAVVKNPRQCQY